MVDFVVYQINPKQYYKEMKTKYLILQKFPWIEIKAVKVYNLENKHN